MCSPTRAQTRRGCGRANAQLRGGLRACRISPSRTVIVYFDHRAGWRWWSWPSTLRGVFLRWSLATLYEISWSVILCSAVRLQVTEPHCVIIFVMFVCSVSVFVCLVLSSFSYTYTCSCCLLLLLSDIRTICICVCVLYMLDNTIISICIRI